MNEILNTVLSGGVAVALIGLVTQIVMWYLKEGNKDTPKVPSYDIDITDTVLEDRLDVQQTIDRVINKTSACRYLILKTENGGGRPRLGSHLYASVIYESVKSPVRSVKQDYQRLLVDDIYVKMLSDIGPGTPNKLKTVRMKSGILKNIYDVEEIKYSEIHYICETNNAFYYLSVATLDDDDIFDSPLDRVEIEISVSRVRDIFTKVLESVK